MPIADLPGIGDRMRTSELATAYAMFFCRFVTFSTFTPDPSSTSYWVTEGPRRNPTTLASTLNCWNVEVNAWITRSLAGVRAACGCPLASRFRSGRRYGAFCVVGAPSSPAAGSSAISPVCGSTVISPSSPIEAHGSASDNGRVMSSTGSTCVASTGAWFEFVITAVSSAALPADDTVRAPSDAGAPSTRVSAASPWRLAAWSNGSSPSYRSSVRSVRLPDALENSRENQPFLTDREPSVPSSSPSCEGTPSANDNVPSPTRTSFGNCGRSSAC